MTNKEEEYYVGPYRLDKVLGRGQTGLVRLGMHCLTAKKVAIKIVNRERLSETVLQKVEREIAIMKLIEHPHVLALYDVYENKRFLYLVLEHVSGGELFDYLVRKGRLTPKEARRFFRQILSATDFCHNHLVCHRDLKPENLLLDEKGNIKVADFGMASLQPEGSLLETSCGSPHYACPEVIRGERYDGRRADIWSCGVILYALLVGCLPFDDDNLHNLLEKVKRGTFHMPSFLTSDACDLIRGMIEVNPEKRLTYAEIMHHPWMNQATANSISIEVPLPQAVKTTNLSLDGIDSDVLTTMGSLQCFRDRTALISELLSEKHNTEKVIYFLLLDRKLRRPANDDPDEVRRKTVRAIDPPKKRVDRWPIKSGAEAALNFGNGSPMVRRKAKSAVDTTLRRNRSISQSNAPQFSPVNSPRHGHLLASEESPQRVPVSARERPHQVRMEHNMNGVAVPRDDERTATINNTNNRALYSRNRPHRAEPETPGQLVLEKTFDPQAIPMIDDMSSEHNGSIAPNDNDDKNKSNNGVVRGDSQQSRWDNRVHDRENGTNSPKLPPECEAAPECPADRVRMSGTPEASPRHMASIMQWRTRLSNIKNSIMGTPRFHRRSRIPMNEPPCDESAMRDPHRHQNNDGERTFVNSGNYTYHNYGPIEPVRRSWFPLLKNDDHHIIVIKDRPLPRVKADLVQAFLATSDLVHTPISPNSFRAEYRRFAGSSILSRSVKFQVDIINAHSDSAPQHELYCLDFWLVSGSYRRFKRIVDTIQSLLMPSSVVQPAVPQSPVSPAINSPAMQQRNYMAPIGSTRPSRRLLFRPGYGNESAPEARVPGSSNYRAAASLSATASEDDDESECGGPSSTASGPTQGQRNNYRANMIHRRRAQYSAATNNNMEVLKVYATPTFTRKHI